MNKITLLALCFSVFGVSKARMPQELSKLLGIGEDSKHVQSPLDNFKEDLKNEPGTLMGNDFDMDKYMSQPPSNMESTETARMKLGPGAVQIHMPEKITDIECYVEFQVIERVPGRCIRLGTNLPACQAEKYIGINYNECS